MNAVGGGVTAHSRNRGPPGEQVARLHLEQLDVRLSELTDKQADYLGIPKEGPYKSDQYRY